MKILVTGSSTGIGFAAAMHLSGKGHQVFGAMRNPAAVPDDVPFTRLRLDVDDDASVRDCVAAAGVLDALVNNAGVAGGGPVELTPLADVKRIFETNYFGAVRMMQAVIPAMRQRGSGAIVNVTSVAGCVANPGTSHYGASKAALESISESVAAQVAPFGIRVAIIEPGVIATPIFSKNEGGSLEDLHPYEAPMRRLFAFFADRLRNDPTGPEVVAEAIEHAITTREPRLRYVVGQDAADLMAVRAGMTDEQWLRIQSLVNDEEYYAELRAAYSAVASTAG